jgi:hypothetical protein
MAAQPTKRFPISYLAISILIQKAAADRAAFEDMIHLMCNEADRLARFDELKRVKAVTLDAGTDVWSTTDDGQTISLTARMKQLSR